MPNPTTGAPTAILNFNGVFETFSGEGENEDPTKIFPDLESPSFFLLGSHYICCIQPNSQWYDCNFSQDFIKQNHSPTK